MVSFDPRSSSAASVAAALEKLRNQPITDDPQALEIASPDGSVPVRPVVDPAVQAANRLIATNDPDAQLVAQGVGTVPERPAATVRSFLESRGLPVGSDPSRIDDPVTRKSLQDALGTAATGGSVDGELDIEVLLGLIEAQLAAERPPAPRPRSAPSRGLRSASSESSSTSQGSSSRPPPLSGTSWDQAVAATNSPSFAGMNMEKAARLASAAEQVARDLNVPGYCAKAARLTLESLGMPITPVPSAYMQADLLAANPNFKEVIPPPANVNDVPPGCMVVWNRTGEDSAVGRHGHIMTTLPGGEAASVLRGQRLSFGQMRVFMPV